MRRMGYGLAFAGLLLVVGCAAGPNGFANTPNAGGEVAGFWLGLWHGAISPLTFVISLFKDTVHFYEVHNSGAVYNLGFLLGAGSLGGGSGAAARRK